MPRNWIYFLLILFVVYLISLNPTDAGTTAHTFFGWLGGMATTAGEFFDGLFDGPVGETVPADSSQG